MTLSHGSLFSGVGGFDLGFQRVGIKTLWEVEIDPYCSQVLAQHFPDAQRFGDIRDFICLLKAIRHESDTLVNAVSESLSPSPLGSSEVGGFAQGLAVTKSCEVNLPQTLEAERGCVVPAIQTGKTELVTTDTNITEAIKSGHGEKQCSDEIATLVRHAVLPQNARGSLTPTISNRGRKPRPNDLTSAIVLPSVAHAIDTLTRPLDVLTAGVPCQPASVAGKRRGRSDDRWLWKETFEVVRLLHPTWCIFENVYGLLNLEGGMVFESLCVELETLGYDIQTFCIPACAVDAPHRRERLWIVGHTDRAGLVEHGGAEPIQTPHPALEYGGASVADARKHGMALIRQSRQDQTTRARELQSDDGRQLWSTQCRLGLHPDGISSRLDCGGWECGVPRVVKGQAHRVDRLRALGNALVPAIAEEIAMMIIACERQRVVGRPALC